MDRVSNLPDEVLCHILSFLTTKEAALTSFLSKRWRNLLALVPCLTIDNSEFLHPKTGKRERPHIRQSFVDFVDRVLALQGNSPLKTFSLRWFTAVDTDRVDGWISNVLARGGVSCDELVCYPLSPKCFECSTLVTLSIGSGIDVTLAASGRVFLPVLKTLVLVWVTVCPNEFETLLHALPSLEELVLTRVIWKGRDVIVSSASVKTLTMYLGFWLKTLSIDTPSLLHFECSGVDASDYPVVNMGSLVDAKINLCELRIKQPGYSSVWKLFHGMRNVSHLSLLPDTLEVLSMCSESSMPVFNNLNSLAIESHKYRGWQEMLALIRNCPNLETIAIKGLVHRVTDECGDVCDCVSREDKGISLTLCPVKVMEIHGFQGTMEEMAMIKHFLDYFPCLKEMEVYATEENNNSTQLGNKRVLEMFELYNKLSSCNVQFCI